MGRSLEGTARPRGRQTRRHKVRSRPREPDLRPLRDRLGCAHVVGHRDRPRDHADGQGGRVQRAPRARHHEHEIVAGGLHLLVGVRYDRPNCAPLKRIFMSLHNCASFLRVQSGARCHLSMWHSSQVEAGSADDRSTTPMCDDGVPLARGSWTMPWQLRQRGCRNTGIIFWNALIELSCWVSVRGQEPPPVGNPRLADAAAGSDPPFHAITTSTAAAMTAMEVSRRQRGSRLGDMGRLASGRGG